MEAPESVKKIGLAARAIAFVSLALLPLGGIAVWQTDQIIKDERGNAERALLAVSEKAAARERQIVERAIGAAAALGNAAGTLRDTPELCRATLDQFERASAFYSFIGFTAADGSTNCFSGTENRDAGNEKLQALIERRTLGLYAERNTDTDAKSVLVVATPAFENGVYIGHTRLHIPHLGFESDSEQLKVERPTNLVTFNEHGEILTSERSFAQTGEALPADTALQDLRHDVSYTYRTTSVSGDELFYAVVPLVPGSAYAIAAWTTDNALLAVETPYWRTIILAVLMWLGSVLVIYLIMQLLVIRGVAKLQKQLKLFRGARILPTGVVTGRGELYDLEADFRGLTETIVREEAELENAVHEKNVLLKEVHHRVKNNLQLINSIINMILRGSRSEETRIVVSRLQDRVMALASVHRSIYQAQSMDRVEAADIVREIVNQGVNIGLPRGSDVDVTIDMEPVTLYPDQAMPLSLMVSEAITNALKYVGGDTPSISVVLKQNAGTETGEQKTASITVSNTVGASVDDLEGTGLGSQLVNAFARQLEGEPEITQEDGIYTLHVSFNISDFQPDEDEQLAAQ